MPKSKRRRRPRAARSRPVSHAQTEAEAARERRLKAERRRRLGWPMAVIGVLLFVGGQIGTRTGWVILPFDRHHVITQISGFLLGIAGLSLAWR